MFDKIYTKVHNPEQSELKICMQKSILHIATILHPPSVTSIATDTRLILSDTSEELKLWIENNKEGFLLHRKLFRDFLAHVQTLQSKINKLMR